MRQELVFAASTLLSWLGWAMVIRGVWFALHALTESLGTAKEEGWRKAGASCIAAALMLGAGLMSPAVSAGGHAGTWRLPIVWFAMPFSAWGVVVCIAAAGFRIIESIQALIETERSAKLKAAGIWLAASAGFCWLYSEDPANKISILKGSIPFATGTAMLIMVLIVASIAAMALAARKVTTKGYAKAVVNQAALIAGSIVFGLPFAFLLITSFKEDRDMASPNGIIWIPKTTMTVPYLDPKNPLFETRHDGKAVQGVIVGDLGGGQVKLDIFMPLSIRGLTVEVPKAELKEIPRDVPIVTATIDGTPIRGIVVENMEDGRQRIKVTDPAEKKDTEHLFLPSEVEPLREVGLNWRNYPEALGYLPPETNSGLVYLKNTLVIVVLSVIGTLISSSIVSYAFSRMKFPGRNQLFALLLATMMLPGAVTMLPQFLIFRSFGWIDTLYPLWVPGFFGSAFNIFLLRQFFMNIPMELEDAAKIDGCSYLKTFWSIMLPQIKPALAVILLWTFLGAWNNFMGPLIYINSPENMPLSYALQLFSGDRSGEPGYLMAFATLTMLPVLAIFFAFQKYFVEGVTLSGLGGR